MLATAPTPGIVNAHPSDKLLVTMVNPVFLPLCRNTCTGNMLTSRGLLEYVPGSLVQAEEGLKASCHHRAGSETTL